MFQSCARARGSGTSLFWAFGGQLAKPKGQLAKPKAQLANHPAQTRWHKLGFLTGCPLGCHLGAVSVHFGTILGCGGDLERPWGPCVPHRCGHTWKHVIFASFWDPLGVPSGTLLGPIFGSGCAREGLASHFGPFFGIQGHHSVFTSQADSRNGQKTAIFEVADVAEV